MKFLTRADVHSILVEHQREMFLLLEQPLDYEAASKHLHISVDHLRRLVMQGKVPHHKPEGRVYFFASELNDHIKKH